MLHNFITQIWGKNITLCPFSHFLLLHDLLCLFGLFKVDEEVQNNSHAVSVVCNAAQPPRKGLSVNAARFDAHFFLLVGLQISQQFDTCARRGKRMANNKSDLHIYMQL